MQLKTKILQNFRNVNISVCATDFEPLCAAIIQSLEDIDVVRKDNLITPPIDTSMLKIINKLRELYLYEHLEIIQDANKY